MKLAVVYNRKDHKLLPDTYSCIYRDMLYAVIKRFDSVFHVNSDCSAQDIHADVILFWDVNSNHHIRIDGIEKHKALKIEYWSDPHQQELKGVYQKYNMYVHKLGAIQRVNRARLRGVSYVISPVKNAFYEYFSPLMNAEKMLWYFPPAPAFEPCRIPIFDRKPEILANGAYWGGDDIGAYEFRKWAFKQPVISFVEHCVKNDTTPKGSDYIKLLSQYAGGLALCNVFPVVKYFEMPLAGMVVFAQYHREYEELGFVHYRNCVYVTKDTFIKRVKDFKDNIAKYQCIADSGRVLIQNNYTAYHFANFIYEKCEKELCHTIQSQQSKTLLGKQSVATC